jgi:hypothetical protein
MSNQQDKTCKDCYHWKEITAVTGSCTVRPPTIGAKGKVFFEGIDKTFEKGNAVWPITHETDGCGEFCHKNAKRNYQSINNAIIDISEVINGLLKKALDDKKSKR